MVGKAQFLQMASKTSTSHGQMCLDEWNDWPVKQSDEYPELCMKRTDDIVLTLPLLIALVKMIDPP